MEMRGGEVSWRGDAVERRVARGDEGPLPPDALLLVPGERKKGGGRSDVVDMRGNVLSG